MRKASIQGHQDSELSITPDHPRFPKPLDVLTRHRRRSVIVRVRLGNLKKTLLLTTVLCYMSEDLADV